jgi:hypothetical protein
MYIAYRILLGKPEEKRPLGRQRRRCVDNIKMDLKEVGWDDVYCISLVEDRDQWRALVYTHGDEPSGSIKCWKFLE